jgi:carboxylesterase
MLPDHGELPERLKGSRWQHWHDGARQALDALSEECEHVFVAGLSMGGLITLKLAAEERAKPASKLRAIAALATPAGLHDKRARLVQIARFVMPWFYPLQFADFSDPLFRMRFKKNYGDLVNIDDAATVAQLRRQIRLPLGALDQLLRFNDHVLKLLPLIQTPVFIAQGRLDRVVALNSADVLGARIGSPRRHIGWYDNCDHEMPLDDDGPQLFADIEAFFGETLRGTPSAGAQAGLQSRA